MGHSFDIECSNCCVKFCDCHETTYNEEYDLVFCSKECEEEEIEVIKEIEIGGKTNGKGQTGHKGQ